MTSTHLLAIFCLLGLLGCAFAARGIDISSDICASITPAEWDCLKKDGYDFAIVQVWRGGYQYTSSIARCVGDAWKAVTQGNNPPGNAITTILHNLANEKVKYDMLWFDVEQCSGCWSDASTNVNFLKEAATKALSMGAHIGFYSSEYEWGATVGGSTAFKQYPLWYAHWDGQASFNDGLYRFGGWTKPAMKQYNDNGPCTSVDVDYAPDGYNFTAEW